MKRGGILNARLAAGLAGLGHTDVVVVADCGLPMPRGPQIVDLALVPGIPSFAAVLDAILGEIVVEGATAASEVSRSPALAAGLHERLDAVELTLVPHEELKRLSADARLVVRTGEATPYANVLLRCGVPF